MDGSKLPKGWKELSPTRIMSEEFGDYVIRIVAFGKDNGEPGYHYHIKLATLSKFTDSNSDDLSPSWEEAIEVAKEFALDTLDDMHTKITQAMDRFEELFDE